MRLHEYGVLAGLRSYRMVQPIKNVPEWMTISRIIDELNGPFSQSELHIEVMWYGQCLGIIKYATWRKLRTVERFNEHIDKVIAKWNLERRLPPQQEVFQWQAQSPLKP